MPNNLSRFSAHEDGDTRRSVRHRRPQQFALTHHALERSNQRNLSDEDIQYVLTHGQLCHVPEGVSYFLGRRNVPPLDRVNDHITRLEGTVVILDLAQEYVITAWRNRRSGTKQLRCRGKHRRP